MERVAIVGSGLIGRSWAMLFAAAGYKVRIYDIEPKQITDALSNIRSQLEHLEEIGLMRGHLTKEQQFQAIEGTNDLKYCIKGAIYIQENVPEILELKKSVHQKIDAIMDPTAILTSSASTIVPSDLCSHLKNRNRFIVAHPTNPPFYAPLVELGPSPWADPDLLPQTTALMKKIGQSPVTVKKEILGYVLNRIQYALLRECFSLIREDVVSVQDLDKVMSDGLGRRYAFIGPFETAYLNAGPNGMLDWGRKYGADILRVCQSFGGPEPFEGLTVNKMQSEMVKYLPLDKLNERRKWRDARLSALAKLKSSYDSEEDTTN